MFVEEESKEVLGPGTGSSGELFEAHVYRSLFVCRHDVPAESRKSIVEVRQRRLVGIMFLRR